MSEKVIICKDCGKEFKLTVGEQNFYADKGFPEPVRCKDCRNKRKADRENQNQTVQQVEEQPKNDLEEMLEKFRANTVLFENESAKGVHKKKNKYNK